MSPKLPESSQLADVSHQSAANRMDLDVPFKHGAVLQTPLDSGDDPDHVDTVPSIGVFLRSHPVKVSLQPWPLTRFTRLLRRSTSPRSCQLYSIHHLTLVRLPTPPEGIAFSGLPVFRLPLAIPSLPSIKCSILVRI